MTIVAARRPAALWLGAVALVLLFASPVRAFAQRDDSSMSEAEVDKLRAAAYVPADRVTVFIKLIDTRTARIQELVSKPRRPGRERDLHDLISQVGAIAEELADNLDDYAPRHRDLRKALPRLVEATERWATALRAPAEDAEYKVARRIALDAVEEVHKTAGTLRTEQVAYFAAHPEAAKADLARSEGGEASGAVVVPRDSKDAPRP